MKGAAVEVTQKMPRLGADGQCLSSAALAGAKDYGRAARSWRKEMPKGLLRSAEERARACKGDGEWTLAKMEKARDCFLLADFMFVCVSPELTHPDVLSKEERFLKRDPLTNKVTGVMAGCFLCGTNAFTLPPPSVGGYIGSDAASNQRVLHCGKAAFGIIGGNKKCFNPSCPGLCVC